MGSATVVLASRRTAGALRSLLVLAFALAWIVAAGNVHAAKKDTSMCDGLKGAAKGLCTAAAALGCGESTKHQKQCDALGDKFEALTGQLAPWEAPPPPPPPPSVPTVTLFYDIDAFDLESATLCEDALGAPCNQSDPVNFREPNDFWMTFDFAFPDEAIVVSTACDDGLFTSGVEVLAGVPFASVDASIIGSLDFLDTEAPLSAGDTIVIRTCNLVYFKIGNAVVGTDRATVAYEQLPF